MNTLPQRFGIISLILLLFSAFGCTNKIRLLKSTVYVYHADLQKIKQEVDLTLSEIDFDTFQISPSSPLDVKIALNPKEKDFLVYHLTPGFTNQEPFRAQLSVLALIQNKGAETINLDRVRIEYQHNNQTIQQDIDLPSDQLVIPPAYAYYWQNNRPYHKSGDVVYLNAPFPDKVIIRFYFKNYRTPISISKRLSAFSQSYALPFLSKDLGRDEYWESYSMHGGGDQVFAYDLGVRAYEDGAWRHSLPGKNGKKNKHFRVWGKPIYAMADGEIIHFLNEVPNNCKPVFGTKEEVKEKLDKQKENYWGSWENQYGGSGNHFYIRHGNVVALYAHMQKNTLNKRLLHKGAIIKKGDFLGLAGNSGNSTAPHLHIHLKTYVNDNAPEKGLFRPLQFNSGYVIAKSEYPSPKSNVNWSALQGQGIPGLEGKDCFISPNEHPYCEYPTNWGEVSKYHVAENIFQQEFDKIYTCGYYPVWIDGYDVNGRTYFNMTFRPSANINWVARHNMSGAGYQTEFDKWSKAGYRLIHIDSYLLNGQIRYTAVWIKDNSVQIMAYHDKPLKWHEANFKRNAEAGWVPKNISLLQVDNQIHVTALWEKKNTGGFYLHPAMTLAEYTNLFSQHTDKEKLKLVYLNGFTINGEPRLSGIWYKEKSNFNTWTAKHQLSIPAFQTEYTNHLNNGFLTRCITAYSDGGVPKFEGIWSK